MKTVQKMASAAAAVLGLMFASTTTSGAQGAAVRVAAPMACTRGPSNQAYTAMVSMPRSTTSGGTIHVRIDGAPSGAISHGGLLYIHNMHMDYLVPPGTRYVTDSLHVVQGTGTENAREGAHVWFDGGGIHLELPAHIDNGQSYTPPTFEFDLKIDAPAGTSLALKFAHYEVMAKVFLLGELHATCEPTPRPFTLGETLVAAPIAEQTPSP